MKEDPSQATIAVAVTVMKRTAIRKKTQTRTELLPLIK